MARLAVSATAPVNSGSGQSPACGPRVATTNPTGDIVVDIDLTKITTITQLKAALASILLGFQSGKELTP